MRPSRPSTTSRSVRARMFSSPNWGSTPETYSEKAVLGERIMILLASSTSLRRYIR